MIKIEATYRLLAETVQDYVQRLSKQGIKKLGSGNYSHVFQHPIIPNVVVKLLHQSDPGYMLYANFCYKGKGKNNPYCPKILQITKTHKMFDNIEGDDSDLALVFMEKLTPISDTDFKKFGIYCAEIINTSYTTSILLRTNTWKNLSQQTKDRKLADVASFLYTSYTQSSSGDAIYVGLDVHKGNVMTRGDQVVIVDPFSS